MKNLPFAVYIVGKDQEKLLQECIADTLRITKNILYIDSGSCDHSVEKAVSLGVNAIRVESSLEEINKLLSGSISFEWFLFLKPDERLKIGSKEKLRKILKKKDVGAYALATTNRVSYDLLEPFQLIKKLDQFKNVKNSTYLSEIEVRLVHREHIAAGLDYMIRSNTERLAEIRNKIIRDPIIEQVKPDKLDEALSVEEHDLRCLKGEISYDLTPEEDLVELSEAYTGFRVLHRGYLESFMKGAKLGFGHVRMYIPMLKFLGEHGYFKEAKNLFECWVENRSDEEIYNTNIMGGYIYSHLLDLDKAIACYERVIECQKSSLARANLGKLYLLKGNREKAIEYLEQVEDVTNDIFMKKKILSAITNPDWKPVTLSLCMIARDEELTINQALVSVSGIVDEIIFVDTGSSDRTKEVIREFGGKVIAMEWKDDFSAARNRALQEAMSDYVLFLDADEYIDSRHRLSLALLKMLLPGSKDVAIMTKVELPKKEKALSIQAWLDTYKEYEIIEYQVRLFPRRQGILFEGALFERIGKSLGDLGIQVTANEMLKITHKMDDREFRERRKVASAIKAFDSVHDPKKLIEGGLLFLRLGDLNGAYPWFEKAEVINPQLASKIALLYTNDDQSERAKNIIEKAIEYFPESSELILSLSEMHYKEGNYQEVINTLADRIETIEKDLELEDTARAVYYHGIASLETGNLSDGIEYLAFAHEKDPANVLYKVAAAYGFAKVDETEEALRLAGQLTDEEGIEVSVSEINDFVDVGKIFMDMNVHFAQAGKTGEANLCRKIVEDVIKTKISGNEDIQRMSAVIEAAGA